MIDRLERLGKLSIVDDAVLYQDAKLFAETKAMEALAAEDSRYVFPGS